MKSRRMRWASHVACIREIRSVWKILVNLKGKRQLGRLSVEEKTIGYILE
jgi:hypothetical protein